TPGHRASMRPRRIRRGERSMPPAGGPHGLSFNAATPNSAWRTMLSWLKRMLLGLLQCGHAEFGVEHPLCAVDLLPAHTASMQPRRIRRGEQLPPGDVGEGNLRGDASMRPRRIRRGEQIGFCDVGANQNGFNAATPNSAWRTLKDAVNDFSKRFCFNAATPN